jgi:MoaA/NifB/PqqE/SkfB family radical SAM enzyme
MKVNCEGDVTMCCFQQRKCLGNILKQSFEEIWSGPIAEAVRADTLKNKLHSTCSCDTCPFIHIQNELDKHMFEFGDIGLPLQMEIDLPTQHCNIGGENPNEKNPACIMCERHTRFVKQEDKLNEVCLKLKPYVRHLKELHIQGVSEPFWKDKIFEITELLGADQFKHKINITTVTNGTILTKQRIERWLEYPNSCVTFSLDASTPETFKKIRILDAYEKIVDNLIIIASLRTPTQRLKIHNNINTLNVREVVGMVELAALVKVDALEFNPTYFTPDIEVNAGNAYLFKEAQQSIIDASRRLGVNVYFLRNLALNY